MLKPIYERVVENFLRGMAGSVRTVYEAVPLSDRWSSHQVMAELHRTGSKGIGLPNVTGTLKVLRQAGLVKEVAPGLFTRHPTKETTRRIKAEQKMNTETNSQKETEIMTKTTSTTSTTAQACSIMNGIAQIAGDLQQAGMNIVRAGQSLDTMIKELREEVDTLPTVTPEISAKLAKLDQFATLMKGII